MIDIAIEKGEHPEICAIRGVSAILPLPDSLLSWAVEHHPEAAVAALGSTDPDFIRRCLGSILRRRAKADLVWLWRVAATSPQELLALSPYIKSIDGLGSFGPIPGPLGWRGWMKDLQTVEGLP